MEEANRAEEEEADRVEEEDPSLEAEAADPRGGGQ